MLMNKGNITHTIKVYNDILAHLVEHLREGDFDNLDISQSKMLIDEINKLTKLKGGMRDDIYKWSDPEQAQIMAFKYLGPSAILYKSERRDKKYKIYDPFNDSWVHFGQMGYEDFTKHRDKIRRADYLKRSANIKGDWISDPYSPNNLSRHILW